MQDLRHLTQEDPGIALIDACNRVQVPAQKDMIDDDMIQDEVFCLTSSKLLNLLIRSDKIFQLYLNCKPNSALITSFDFTCL